MIITDPDDWGDKFGFEINYSDKVIKLNKKGDGDEGISIWDLQMYLKTDGEFMFPKSFNEVDKGIVLDLINFGEVLYPYPNEVSDEVVEFVKEYFNLNQNKDE